MKTIINALNILIKAKEVLSMSSESLEPEEHNYWTGIYKSTFEFLLKNEFNDIYEDELVKYENQTPITDSKKGVNDTKESALFNKSVSDKKNEQDQENKKEQENNAVEMYETEPKEKSDAFVSHVDKDEMKKENNIIKEENAQELSEDFDDAEDLEDADELEEIENIEAPDKPKEKQNEEKDDTEFETPKRTAEDGDALIEGLDYIGKPPVRMPQPEEHDQEEDENEPEEKAPDIEVDKHSEPQTKSNTQEIFHGASFKKRQQKTFEDVLNKLPSELHQDEFTFCYDAIKISSPAGEVEEAEIIVAPLKYVNGQLDIAMWVNSDQGTVVRTSYGSQRKTVLAHLSTADLIVKGIYENNEFSITTSLTKKETDAGYILENNIENMNGKGGHLLVDDEGIEVHIFPISFVNNKYGDADFFYVILQNEEAKGGDTSSGEIPKFEYQGETLKIRSKWHEESETLFAEVGY